MTGMGFKKKNWYAFLRVLSTVGCCILVSIHLNDIDFIEWNGIIIDSIVQTIIKGYANNFLSNLFE